MSKILLESGDALLQESGDALLLAQEDWSRVFFDDFNRADGPIGDQYYDPLVSGYSINDGHIVNQKLSAIDNGLALFNARVDQDFSPDHWVSFNIETWTAPTSPVFAWLWCRAAGTADQATGFYAYLFGSTSYTASPYYNGLRVQLYRWEPNYSYVYIDQYTINADGLLPPGGLYMRLQAKGDQITVHLDERDGNGLVEVLSHTDTQYMNQRQVGLGLEEYYFYDPKPPKELVVDNFDVWHRAGNARVCEFDAVFDDRITKTAIFDPVVNSG